jgi:hypothetical protein
MIGRGFHVTAVTLGLNEIGNSEVEPYFAHIPAVTAGYHSLATEARLCLIAVLHSRRERAKRP